MAFDSARVSESLSTLKRVRAPMSFVTITKPCTPVIFLTLRLLGHVSTAQSIVQSANNAFVLPSFSCLTRVQLDYLSRYFDRLSRCFIPQTHITTALAGYFIPSNPFAPPAAIYDSAGPLSYFTSLV